MRNGLRQIRDIFNDRKTNNNQEINQQRIFIYLFHLKRFFRLNVILDNISWEANLFMILVYAKTNAIVIGKWLINTRHTYVSLLLANSKLVPSARTYQEETDVILIYNQSTNQMRRNDNKFVLVLLPFDWVISYLIFWIAHFFRILIYRTNNLVDLDLPRGCLFDSQHEKHKYCTIFKLATITEEAGKKFKDMAVEVILVYIY